MAVRIAGHRLRKFSQDLTSVMYSPSGERVGDSLEMLVAMLCCHIRETRKRLFPRRRAVRIAGTFGIKGVGVSSPATAASRWHIVQPGDDVLVVPLHSF